ncbi:aminotransferase [Dialister succinatiphilus]|uniref:aminotransferase n=1 Tax=Dialister succinatiphilus TaxID=487173 RepID=UPI00266F9F20|nr:aminotransferase [uncultured Dialister sp.]
MNIKPFAVEEWMNAYETGARYNIAETCVDSISLDELFELSGTHKESFLNKLCARRLTYGYIEGSPDLKEGIAALYHTIRPDEIVPAHGASGANHHVFYSLINPGDKVISIMPSYQQLYSIPASLGAKVEILHLKKENSYLPDLEELEEMARGGVKMICLNNPNNPTGALMSPEILKKVVDIAKKSDAYLLVDEVYRHLTQDDEWQPSIVDMYEKGISTSSMSKVFSLAGVRLGWIATHDKDALKQFWSHRDYNLISCGMIDDTIAALALASKNQILERNKKNIRENLDILDHWIQKEPRLSYVKPKAGTTALVYYDFPIDSYTLCRRMYGSCGTFVTPGDCFDEPHSMRIGYAADRDTLKKGLQAMSTFLDSLEAE